MAGDIEVIYDDSGVVVAGDPQEVQLFLDGAGLATQAQEFDLTRLRVWLEAGGSVAETVSGALDQSAMYLKLTPESARRLKDAGGLMKTQTPGISHVMLGRTGTTSMKWLQAQDGPASLLTNPAVLSGLSGLMTQAALQTEAHEFRASLLRIEEKLDDERRARRDKELAQLESLANALDDAQTLRRHGGDPQTTWAKVSQLSWPISNVQTTALGELRRLVEKVESKTNAPELKRALREAEREVALQLAILGRCFELQDEFRVLELDHVFDTAEGRLEGHRSGLAEIHDKRRAGVLDLTTQLMARLDAAADVANKQAILHQRATRSVVDVLNATAELVDDFHTPLGIASQRDPVAAIPWRDALRNPQQRKTAGQEIGQKATLVVAGGVTTVGLVAAAKKASETLTDGGAS